MSERNVVKKIHDDMMADSYDRHFNDRKNKEYHDRLMGIYHLRGRGAVL